MTKAFILILMVSGQSSGGVTTAEFATKEACEAAAAAVTMNRPRFFVLKAYCVDNGGSE